MNHLHSNNSGRVAGARRRRLPGFVPPGAARYLWALLLSWSLASLLPAAQAATPTLAETEIAHLLMFVRSSGCGFYRNGSWYTAAEGAEHLETKYRVLASYAQIDSADDFIENAASVSSMSGRPYQLRCGTDATIDTGPWLHAELAAYRLHPPGRDAAAELLVPRPATTAK